MKRLAICLSLLCVFNLFNQPTEIIHAQKPEHKTDIKLTADQQEELENLYNEMFETKKQLINKYAEYDVITQNKAEEKLARLDKFQEKLKEHGYVPHWPHHGKKYNCDKSE
ncbi:DUF2680 domain-containing protein [Bacillus luteolus]|uniref:DUF2680 domain-containing protein n=1 Tax=Litchfieldia luteola TaxID=682179 RepID=A0ABR9QG78_9BACI|nr:DUF2680 domain-containing protein [Cytobacillus luteolus]MBE4907490.1 DUF2680 domain-containing protein [Cytobacillus luteolus]MBP1944258.1 ribosomal protein S20 [Cytobacillus luteolus]